jgi:hypothetical protein
MRKHHAEVPCRATSSNVLSRLLRTSYSKRRGTLTRHRRTTSLTILLDGSLEAAKRFLNGDVKSLDRALGLLRPPGRPVDPNKSKNLGLAEIALMSRMQGKTWAEINNEVFADRAEPPDERHIRTLVDRYKPLVMQKWRKDLRRRWLAGSEAREKNCIQKNEKKGKSRTPNSV